MLYSLSSRWRFSMHFVLQFAYTVMKCPAAFKNIKQPNLGRITQQDQKKIEMPKTGWKLEDTNAMTVEVWTKEHGNWVFYADFPIEKCCSYKLRPAEIAGFWVRLLQIKYGRVIEAANSVGHRAANLPCGGRSFARYRRLKENARQQFSWRGLRACQNPIFVDLAFNVLQNLLSFGFYRAVCFFF